MTELASSVYENSEYLIARRQHRSKNVVVLVHGLVGTNQGTWGRLPDLLLAETNYDVFLVGFPSRYLGHAAPIDDLGRYLRTVLDGNVKTGKGQPYKNIVLVGHSQGGPIIQSAIVQTLASGGAERPPVSQVRWVVMYAPPLRGAQIPDIAKFLRRFFPISPPVLELAHDSDTLSELQHEWIERVYRPDQSLHHSVRRYIPQIIVTGLDDVIVKTGDAAAVYGKKHLKAVAGDHWTLKNPDGKRDPRFVVLADVLGKASRFQISAALVFAFVASFVVAVMFLYFALSAADRTTGFSGRLPPVFAIDELPIVLVIGGIATLLIVWLLKGRLWHETGD